MGAGKTSVGRVLAGRLGWTFEDLDVRIERRERRSVAEIFRASGEAGFRRAEQAALKELLNDLPAGGKKIVALGGGAFASPGNVALIESANIPTVFLDGEVEELWQRCGRQAAHDGMERPLLGNLEGFRNLHDLRRPHYLKALILQNTSGKTIEQVAVEIIRSLGLDPDGDQKSRRRGKGSDS